MTRLPATAHVSSVSLCVADRAAALRFYGEALGFEVVEQSGSTVALGARDHAFLVLEEDDGAPVATRRVGLFHAAFLFPDRGALAEVVRRTLALGYRLSGASDHGVSEALYLDDPEGNGVELYRDRSPGDWPRTGDGTLAMVTRPLDLDRLWAELPGGPSGAGQVTSAPRLGHIHLRVTDLAAAERFYTTVVGFDLMQRFGHEAAFLSAGGYHHHLGMNTWGTRGLDVADPSALGLARYTIRLGEEEGLADLRERLAVADHPWEATGDGVSVVDPSGHRVVLAP